MTDLLISGDDSPPREQAHDWVRDGRGAVLLLVLGAVGVLGLRLSGRAEVKGPVLFLGLIVGLSIAVPASAVGLVHQRTGVVALSAFGFGGFATGLLTRFGSGSAAGYWAVFVLAAVVSAAASVAVGLVTQRMRSPYHATALTLAVAYAARALGQWIGPRGPQAVFPAPPGLWEFRVGPLLVTRAYTGMLLFGTVLVVLTVLLVILRGDRLGGPVVWALLGGGLAISLMLTAPTQGFVRDPSFEQGALVVACVGIAGMRPLLSIVTSVLFGVTEQLILWNYPHAGVPQQVLGGALLVATAAWCARREAPPHAPKPPRLRPWVLVTAAMPLALAIFGADDFEGRRYQVLIVLTLLVALTAANVGANHDGLSLSVVPTGLVGALVAFHLADVTPEALVLMPVAALAAAAMALVLTTLTRRTVWATTMVGLGLMLALTAGDTSGSEHSLLDVRRVDLTFFGHELIRNGTETWLPITALAVTLLVGLLWRTGSPVQIALRLGLLSGTVGFATAASFGEASNGQLGAPLMLATVLGAAVFGGGNVLTMLLGGVLVIGTPLIWNTYGDFTLAEQCGLYALVVVLVAWFGRALAKAPAPASEPAA